MYFVALKTSVSQLCINSYITIIIFKYTLSITLFYWTLNLYEMASIDTLEVYTQSKVHSLFLYYS